MNIDNYTDDAIKLLTRLVATPSVSHDEKAAADIMEQTIKDYGFEPHRLKNNVWTISPDYDESRPTILLNAHIDTVKPVKTWTRDPFKPDIDDDKLFGLGANDCGGGLVSLLQTFRILNGIQNSKFKIQNYDYQEGKVDDQEGKVDDQEGKVDDHEGKVDAWCNIVYLASAEEEVSGKDGISLVLPKLPKIDVAIVGEPTGMQPAIAEKGLMVLDMIAHGRSGHAARNEGINAIYEALPDIEWIRDYKFQRVSKYLGPVKMTVTVINAGTQHNVIPDECRMLVDVRTNELYTNREVFDIIDKNTKSDIHAHSFRLQSSHIDADHPLVSCCIEMGMKPFGSPTLSDQALMPFPSLKLGPGDSSRSHSADEYIRIDEISNAIKTYVELLENKPNNNK